MLRLSKISISLDLQKMFEIVIQWFLCTCNICTNVPRSIAKVKSLPRLVFWRPPTFGYCFFNKVYAAFITASVNHPCLRCMLSQSDVYNPKSLIQYVQAVEDLFKGHS